MTIHITYTKLVIMMITESYVDSFKVVYNNHVGHENSIKLPEETAATPTTRDIDSTGSPKKPADIGSGF